MTFALLHSDKRPHRSSPKAWLHRKSLNNCPLCSLIFPCPTESETPLLKPHHQIFLFPPSDTARSCAYEWIKIHNIVFGRKECLSRLDGERERERGRREGRGKELFLNSGVLTYAVSSLLRSGTRLGCILLLERLFNDSQPFLGSSEKSTHIEGCLSSDPVFFFSF